MNDDPTQPPAVAPAETKIDYSLSAGLVARLHRLDIALAFTSYQSGLLYCLGRDPKGGAHLHQAAFPKPMGLALDAWGDLVLSTGFQILRLANVLEPHQRINETFDRCYLPRRIHLTGQLDAHDVAVDAADRPVFVNTRFNCLATTSPRHSFEALWRPPFVSALIDEDRCHLNGLAMAEGRPAYVTAVSRSDTIDGWRDRRADGGVVVEVASGRVVCEGLSMPHSPRLHRGELWLLNAGSGELGVVAGGASSPGSSAPASCAAWPSTRASPSSACRSRATSASRAWRWTRRCGSATRSPGAGCRSSSWRAAPASSGSASTAPWARSTTSRCCPACAVPWPWRRAAPRPPSWSPSRRSPEAGGLRANPSQRPGRAAARACLTAPRAIPMVPPPFGVAVTPGRGGLRGLAGQRG